MEYLRLSSITDDGFGGNHRFSPEYSQDLSRIQELTVEQVLCSPQIIGAVISGPSGSGRRAWAEAGLDKLLDPPQLIRLNGSNFGTKVPLGTLSYLLAQLDLGEYTSRHELVHGLGRILFVRNQPATVLLGRPELIDEESSSLLAQLATMGKIKLIVICEQVQDLPSELFALYRSGRFKHQRIHRMDFAASRRFVEAELGGRVSTFCSAVLRDLTSGNRELMLKLMNCWRKDHQLIQRHGTWVLDLSNFGLGSATQALNVQMISGLAAQEYELMLALALGGPVNLDRIHLCGLTEPLDMLLNEGLARYLPGASHRVGLYNPLLALLVRANPHEARMDNVQTLLKNLHPDPHAAQVLAQMQTLSDMNDFGGQIEVAQRFQIDGYGPSCWHADAETRVKIVEMHVKALSLISQFDSAVDVIETARTGVRLAMSESGQDAALEVACQELDLAYFAVHLEDGLNGTKNGNSGTSELAESVNWMNERLRLRALSIQSSVWAARNRQAHAMKLSRQVDERLREAYLMSSQLSTLTPEDAADIECHLLQAELMSGQWNMALSRAKKLAAGTYSSPLSITQAESFYGIILALRNDLEGAVAVLEPLQEQLTTLGLTSLATTVDAVMAYAIACSGKRQEAGAMLERHAWDLPSGQSPLNFYRWVREIFTALAHARIDGPDQALPRLESFTNELHAQGCTFLEMLTLAYRIRLGDLEQLSELERVGGLCHGSVGQTISQLADSLMSGESQRMADGMSRLIGLGHILLTSPAQNQIFALLDARGQRRITRIINEAKRSLTPQAVGIVQDPSGTVAQQPDWMRELTKREAQIASLVVKGKSNAEIAKVKGVSIRTVEGHLYQVYSKLQVRNRQELAALDRSSRGASGLR